MSCKTYFFFFNEFSACDWSHSLIMTQAFRFVNEAATCLQEGIVESPVAGDIGAVFGIGFPPFLGGPFRFLDAFGAHAFVDRMRGFEAAHGGHFAPAPIIVDAAKNGTKFHP